MLRSRKLISRGSGTTDVWWEGLGCGRGFTSFFLTCFLLLAIAASSALAAGPKNVIFFIGDGMGPEQVKAANYYNGGPLSFELLPYQGLLMTYAANNSVTDSAASGTALATGYKANNGVISEARPANPDYPVFGSEMETLLERAKAEGKSTGLVTTTYLTHATPATFGAHTSNRNNLGDIGNDYLNQTRPNVLFGGGGNGLSTGAAASAGYTVVTDRAAMQALNTQTETMVSGLFGGDHLPYEYDGVGSLPHLSEMTVTALDILDNDPDGFFLMVEGGRIDHAGHSNLPRHNVRETIEFGNSVQEAINWATGRTDTLILVTADHETGGMSVIGDNGPGNYPNISWSSGGHTSVNVPIYAWGAGADLISGVMDNTEMFNVVTADVTTFLAWDEKGPGEWGQQRWTGTPGLNVPDEITHVEIKSDTVTVAAHSLALTLTVTSGSVVVGGDASLTVGEGVYVAADATLDVAGELYAQSLSTDGTSVIRGGAIVSVRQSVDLVSDAVLDVAGNLDARSISTFGTNIIRSGAIVSVRDGADLAPGATLELAGTLHAQWLSMAGTNMVADGASLSVASRLTLESSLDLAGATLTTIPQLTKIDVNPGAVLILGQVLRGAELNVAGTVETAGAELTALSVTAGGLLSSSADVIAEDVNVTGGAIHLTDGANLNVGTIQISGGTASPAAGGTVNTGAGYLVVGEWLKIGDNTSIHVSGATFKVSSQNLADPIQPANITLGGGSLTMGGGSVTPSGAIAIWKFREQDGLTAADSSVTGNDHPGTLNGATWVADDPQHLTALRFDGDDYVEIANIPDVELGGPFTMAMWIKTSQKGVKLVGKGYGDHLTRLAEKALYIDPTGQVKFSARMLGAVHGATNVADGRWHHVAVTYDGDLAAGSQEIYVDGVNDTASRLYWGGADVGDAFRLGWAETRDGGSYQEYIGVMDDVYLYDRSLNAEEVADLSGAFASVLEAKPNINLRVTADSALYLDATSGAAVLGNLTLDSAVALRIAGAAVGFNHVAAHDGSSIQGDLSVAGTLSGGDSPGRIDVIGKLTLSDGSIYQWQLGPGTHDLVALEGNLTLADGWTLRLIDAGGTSVASEGFDLFTYTGTYTGLPSFDGATIDGSRVEGSGRWDWSQAEIHVDGNRVYLTGLIVVPEPAATTLAAIALLGFLVRVRRGRRRA